jgi:superfamily II DNA/RNA helicase
MSGKAISFVLPDQRNKIRDIERLTRLNLPVSQLPELPKIESVPGEKPERYIDPRSRNNFRNRTHSRFRYAQKRY